MIHPSEKGINTFKNLSYRVSIYFLILAIIISGFIIFIGYHYIRDLMFESNRYRLQFEVREILDDVENSMDDASRFTRHLAMDFNQEEMQIDPHKLMKMIFDGQPYTSSFTMVISEANNHLIPRSTYTLFRSGEVILSDSSGYVSKNNMANAWIIRMLDQSKPEWSPPYYDLEICARVVNYAYPFDYIHNGLTVHATFFCLVNIDRHLRNLNKQRMIKSGLAILLNEKNQIVYHPDSLETGKNISSVIGYFEKSKLDVIRLLADRPTGFQLIYSDTRTVVIYWPIRSSNWYMILAVPEIFFISELKRLSLFIIPIFLFIGSIVAIITIYNSIKLISPISYLADDSRKIVEEAEFEPEIISNDPKFLSDSPAIWRLANIHPISSMTDIQAISENMDKIKDRLANYRESTIQNSLDRKELEKELKLARDIEMGMVPTNFPLAPNHKDFDCYGKLIPAKIVGGDLFDLFLLDDNQLFISITDTLGKGIPAAMYSVMTRTFIRSIANPITRLGKIMESLNDALSQVHDSDMFATVFLSKLNLKTGEMIYCNAGHPHPIILRNNKKHEILSQSHGIPVGVKRKISFTESRLILASGESLIAYTDGITEQNNEHGEFFGLDRLISIVNPIREKAPQIIVNKTLDALGHFQGKTEVHDDITLVAIKFLGSDKFEPYGESHRVNFIDEPYII